jgi:hypothetical protein
MLLLHPNTLTISFCLSSQVILLMPTMEAWRLMLEQDLEVCQEVRDNGNGPI